jgi:NDP-sugar pyrophosphorylase family protein
VSLRALVLAAGRGERLRPLTLELPKPLLPVAGRPLAAWTLDRLAALGADEAALNLHHLGDSIRAAFGERFETRANRRARRRALPLRYSDESALLLGTGGALPPLGEFFRGAELALLVNGDSLCRWPLRELVAHHRRAGARATLLVHRAAEPHAFGGGLALEGGRVVAFRRGHLAWEAAGTKRVFAGAAVIDPALVERLPAGHSDIVSALYEPLLDAGEPIAALETARPWFDLGTPARYLEAALAWALAPKGGRGHWTAPGAAVDPTARPERSVVESGARVEPGARLVESLVLPGARVGAGARLERTLVGPGVEIAEGARFARALLTRDARTGALVETPLGA